MILDITIIGGGMIVHDQILPTLYHMQRTGRAGDITVVATRTKRLRDLVSERFQQAFPGQTFAAHPSLDGPDEAHHPELWRDVVAQMKPRQLVVVATPDELHDEIVRAAIEADQHVLCVKPLVHRYTQTKAIGELAARRGLFVGVEYHKRFDRRSLEARGHYRAGRFGAFKCGEAKLIEPWNYRHSNFQNWFTKEKTDPFTYIGCHYVDLVYFITGLRPTEVSVQGVEGKFPNGNVAHMWSAARVRFEGHGKGDSIEEGGILSVINGLGYPDDGAGSNDQGMCLFCEDGDGDGGEATGATTGSGGRGAVIRHDDQFRGVSYGFVEPVGGKAFHFVNPDYFRLVPWEGAGLKPVGYGYDSIEANVLAATGIEDATADLSGDEAASKRRKLIAAIDERGLIATPRNSYINELVVEAARLSIGKGGARVRIEYGEQPGVSLV